MAVAGHICLITYGDNEFWSRDHDSKNVDSRWLGRVIMFGRQLAGNECDQRACRLTENPANWHAFGEASVQQETAIG